MSWREAPLYVEAYDLSRWLLERSAGWKGSAGALLAPRIADEACALVTASALALTFPGERTRHLVEVDEAIVRLRCLLRLASDLGLLSAGGLRFASGRLRSVGRMVGGWRKRWAAKARGLAARSAEAARATSA